jgi:hypothetical protein
MATEEDPLCLPRMELFSRVKHTNLF